MSLREKSWPSVIIPLISVANHIITVVGGTTLGIHPKQAITLLSGGFASEDLEVKEVIDRTTFRVGPIKSSIATYSNPIAFNGGSASIPSQNRNAMDMSAGLRAAYMEEPAVALRTVGVTWDGEFISDTNPMPVDIVGGVSLSVNLDGFDLLNPDSVQITGSSDGSMTGIKRGLKINPTFEALVIDEGVRARLDISNTLIANTNALLAGTLTVSGPFLTDAQLRATPVPVSATLVDEPIKVSGTENGQPNGTEFTLVNNRKLQILAAKDKSQAITYADFGTKDQRITRIDYTATSIGTGANFTARKDITYTLVGNNYRMDNITWSII
jgi:hypothetical protein